MPRWPCPPARAGVTSQPGIDPVGSGASTIVTEDDGATTIVLLITLPTSNTGKWLSCPNQLLRISYMALSRYGSPASFDADQCWIFACPHNWTPCSADSVCRIFPASAAAAHGHCGAHCHAGLLGQRGGLLHRLTGTVRAGRNRRKRRSTEGASHAQRLGPAHPPPSVLCVSGLGACGVMDCSSACRSFRTDGPAGLPLDHQCQLMYCMLAACIPLHMPPPCPPPSPQRPHRERQRPGR